MARKAIADTLGTAIGAAKTVPPQGRGLDSLKAPPQQFSAWLGIRFRSPDDDKEISDDLDE